MIFTLSSIYIDQMHQFRFNRKLIFFSSCNVSELYIHMISPPTIIKIIHVICPHPTCSTLVEYFCSVLWGFQQGRSLSYTLVTVHFLPQ